MFVLCRDEAEETYEDEFEEEEQDAEQLEAGKAPVEMLVLRGQGMGKAMLQSDSCSCSLSLKRAKIKMTCLENDIVERFLVFGRNVWAPKINQLTFS